MILILKVNYKNRRKKMEDKQIINVLVNKIQKLNQEILQQELNVAGKEIELAAANEKIDAYVSNITNGEDNVYPEEEPTN